MKRRPIEILSDAKVPGQVLMGQPGLYMQPFTAARLMFLAHLYEQVVDIPGSVMEFGVRWGQDLVWFHHMRALWDPHYGRQIVGFDTFTGFPSVAPEDGDHQVGELAIGEHYPRYLAELLDSHESTIYPHETEPRFTLVVGDATKTIHEYLVGHQETIVALAYFDIDLYEPTKACLEAIMPRLTKGSVIGFDELACHDWPGETQALREVMGLSRYRLRRTRWSATNSYLVVE